jgi:hypothetical protein
LIAVPVVILQSRSAPVEMGSEPPLITASPGPSEETRFSDDGTAKIPYRSQNGETVSAGPMVVGSKGTPGQPIYVYAYTVRSPKGQSLCFAVNEEGNEINGAEQAAHGTPNCAPIAQPKSGFSWGMAQAAVSTNAGATYVYVMSKPADKLMLRDVNDRLIVAQQRATNDEFTMFVAYMDSKQVPKAWTVKDAAGTDLQHGP